MDCSEEELRVEKAVADLAEIDQQIVDRTALCAQIEDPVGQMNCNQSLRALHDERDAADLRKKRAEDALRNCEADLPDPGFRFDSGHLVFLHVRDEVGFGPDQDAIAANVIFRFDEFSGRSFGFALRDDALSPVRQAQLDLLRDAFTNDYRVVFEYEQVLNKFNSLVRRISIQESNP
jgi:hypothetical protein